MFTFGTYNSMHWSELLAAAEGDEMRLLISFAALCGFKHRPHGCRVGLRRIRTRQEHHLWLWWSQGSESRTPVLYFNWDSTTHLPLIAARNKNAVHDS